MSSDCIMLEVLSHTDLYLDSPMPLELSGGEGNWVAVWEETASLSYPIEGEGETEEEAVADFKETLIARYMKLSDRLSSGAELSEDNDRIWIAMCHYIGTRAGKVMQGEEYSTFAHGKAREKYKGPVYG